MQLKSNPTIINKSPEELYNFIDKLENFKHLMPPSVEKFEVDGESFVFGIKGMPEIRLVTKEKSPFSKYVLAAASSKLNFSLSTFIKGIADNKSEVEIVFDGEMNPMMAMMVKKPLTKFMEGLSTQLSQL